MTGFHKLIISKVFALLLIFLLFYGRTVWGTPRPYDAEPKTGKVKAAENFDAALKEYNAGLYEQAKEKLEQILSLDKEGAPGLKAKVYLLLGACYEKSGEKVKARDCFRELKGMFDKGLINQVPEVKGVYPGELIEHQEVFGEKAFFNHKEPTPVSEIIKNNVVHAPRKTREEKEREKRRKRFPWLLAVGGVILVGAAAVLLLSKKRNKKEVEAPTIEWVRIPAGEFLMGDNFNEGEADELPVHKVYLDEYYISKYEINISQYNIFCEETGRQLPVEINPGNFHSQTTQIEKPIHYVSWDDARAFCDWMSQKTGENINLPTEAQWEKAARGTQQYRYPWGNNSPDCTLANYFGCAGIPINPSRVRPVRSYFQGKSPYGVYNMAGNVAEWCRDWYSHSYYSVSPQKNPQGPGKGSYRVIRGGSVATYSNDLRAANRDFNYPYLKDLGFRIVKEK